MFLQNLQYVTTSPNEVPTPLAVKVANVRRRRTATSSRLIDGRVFMYTMSYYTQRLVVVHSLYDNTTIILI